MPGPDLVLRLAALLHDIGKPRTRRFEEGGGVSFHHHEMVGAKLVAKRLKELRFDKATVQAVARLTELHLRFHGYGEGEWTDSAVRRYVTDAGPLLERLHRLTRSDCTTRNLRKAARLSAAYDDLEERIARLQEQEELDSVRPDLDGTQIMEILGLRPGPRGGRGVPVPARAADGARAARARRRARGAARVVGCARLTTSRQTSSSWRSPTQRRDQAVADRGRVERRRAGRESSRSGPRCPRAGPRSRRSTSPSV